MSKEIPLATFVKTPEFSAVKTRLASETSQHFAETVYDLCLSVLTEKLALIAKQTNYTPIWAVAELEGVKDERWDNFPTVFQGVGDLGERLSCVYGWGMKAFGKIAIIGSDSPQIPLDVFIKAEKELNEAKGPHFVFGPAYDGGFYFVAGNKELKENVWLDIPYSSGNAGEKLLEKLRREGAVTLLPTIRDLDTVLDLYHVLDELEKEEINSKGNLKSLLAELRTKAISMVGN